MQSKLIGAEACGTAAQGMGKPPRILFNPFGIHFSFCFINFIISIYSLLFWIILSW
jgi:hypothetical protein